ncbi:hypothetical protein LMIY3S_00812 [Labrys miyagiensis]
MFRKLVLAAAIAVGMGGSLLATQEAQAAVAHPNAPATAIQAVQQADPAARGVEQVQYRRYYHRPYYRQHRVCRVRRVRVHTYYGWRWVNRRVCWWR